MNSPTWSNMFVSFTASYTTAQNGNCYSLDTSGDIYYYDAGYSSWTWMAGPSSNTTVSISTSIDGSLTAVDSTGSAYLYSYGTWSTLSNAAMSAAVGDSTHYIVVNTSGTATKYSNGISSNLSSSGGPTKISTTANCAQIYGVDGTGAVYQRTGSVWTTISGKTLKQVDVSLSSTNSVQICGVDASGNGWMYNGMTWTSINKPSGVSTSLVSLEAGSHSIWATFSNGSVYFGSF